MDGAAAANDRQSVRQFMPQYVQVQQGGCEQPAAAQHHPHGSAHQGVPYGNGEEDIEATGGMGQLVAQGHGRDQGQRKQDKGGYGMPDEPGSAREIHEGKFLAFVLPVFGGYLGRGKFLSQASRLHCRIMSPRLAADLGFRAVSAYRRQSWCGGVCLGALGMRCEVWNQHKGT